MPTLATTFRTGNQSGTGSTWANPENALASDNSRASVSDNPPTAYTTKYLLVQGLASPPPSRARGLTEVRITVEHRQNRISAGPYVDDVIDAFVHLIDADGNILTSVNKTTGVAIAATDTAEVYTFSAANLATLGITIGHLMSSSFGLAIRYTKSGATDEIQAEVDNVSIEYDYSTTLPIENTNMDFHKAINSGGLLPIGSPLALANVTASDDIFAAAPTKAMGAILSVTGDDLVINWSGETATTTAGIRYAAGGVYFLPFPLGVLRNAKAIEAGTSFVGCVQYVGNDDND